MSILNVDDKEWQEAEAFFQEEQRKQAENPDYEMEVKFQRRKVAEKLGNNDRSNKTAHSFILLNGEIWALNNVHVHEPHAGKGGMGVARIAENRTGKRIVVKQEAKENRDALGDAEVDELSRAAGYLLGRTERRVKYQEGEKGIIKAGREISTSTKVYTGYEYRGDRNLYGEQSRIRFFSEEEKLNIALRCMMGIKALHDLRIIHKDIKQENFVVNGQGEDLTILPIDFDMSQRLAEGQDHVLLLYSDNTPRVIGTKGFIAPESQESGKYSYATDVYALGKMLEELGLPYELYSRMMAPEKDRISLNKAMDFVAKEIQNYPNNRQLRKTLNEYYTQIGETPPIMPPLVDSTSVKDGIPVLAKELEGKSANQKINDIIKSYEDPSPIEKNKNQGGKKNLFQRLGSGIKAFFTKGPKAARAAFKSEQKRSTNIDDFQQNTFQSNKKDINQTPKTNDFVFKNLANLEQAFFMDKPGEPPPLPPFPKLPDIQPLPPYPKLPENPQVQKNSPESLVIDLDQGVSPTEDDSDDGIEFIIPKVENTEFSVNSDTESVNYVEPIKVTQLFDRLSSASEKLKQQGLPNELKGLITEEQLEKIYRVIQQQRANINYNLKDGQPYRLGKETSGLARTLNFIFDPKTGDIELILETKRKKVNDKGDTYKDKTVPVFSGASKSTKAAWRIDTPTPVKMANAVYYASDVKHQLDDLRGARIEGALAKKAVEGLGAEGNLINVTTEGQQRLLSTARNRPEKNGVPGQEYYAKQSHYSEFAVCDLQTFLTNPGKYQVQKEDLDRMAESLLKGVKILHDKGIIHQDIKPDNILVYQNEKGQYYLTLTDFGISHHSALKPASQALATLGYESPEISAGHSDGVGQTAYFQDQKHSSYGREVYQKLRAEGKTYSDQEKDIFMDNPDKANDMWAVGIVLHQLYNNGLKPKVNENIQGPPIISALLNPSREKRSNVEQALASYADNKDTLEKIEIDLKVLLYVDGTPTDRDPPEFKKLKMDIEVVSNKMWSDKINFRDALLSVNTALDSFKPSNEKEIKFCHDLKADLLSIQKRADNLAQPQDVNRLKAILSAAPETVSPTKNAESQQDAVLSSPSRILSFSGNARASIPRSSVPTRDQDMTPKIPEDTTPVSSTSRTPGSPKK